MSVSQLVFKYWGFVTWGPSSISALAHLLFFRMKGLLSRVVKRVHMQMMKIVFLELQYVKDFMLHCGKTCYNSSGCKFATVTSNNSIATRWMTTFWPANHDAISSLITDDQKHSTQSLPGVSRASLKVAMSMLFNTMSRKSVTHQCVNFNSHQTLQWPNQTVSTG